MGDLKSRVPGIFVNALKSDQFKDLRFHSVPDFIYWSLLSSRLCASRLLLPLLQDNSFVLSPVSTKNYSFNPFSQQ